MTEKIKVLFLAANPDNTGRIRLDREVKEIERMIKLARHRDSFELISKWAVTIKDLRQALLEHRPHIVHFSGHGNKSKRIIVEGDSGETNFVDRRALARLFEILKDNIRIVVFNACFTQDQASWISRTIDFTIGMSKAIGDKEAIVFAGTLYSGLGYGRSVKEAFELARNAIEIEFTDSPQYKIPVLLSKKGVDASKAYLPIEPLEPLPAEILQLKQQWSKEPDPWARYWLAISIGSIGGESAFETLRGMRSNEFDEFALMGIDQALKLANERPR